MTHTMRSHLLFIALLAKHVEGTAADAFMPPEVVPSKRYSSGLQVEFEGTHSIDSVRAREERKAFCEWMGKPYVNTVPVEEVGRARRIVVQTDGLSYTWLEIKFAGADERGEICRLGPKTLRSLTIARFDGKQTTTTTYDYDMRTTGGHVDRGDKTYFGANSPNVPSAEQLRPYEVGEQRVIAGVPCSVRRIFLGTNEVTHCVTGPDPVPGRTGPLALAMRLVEMNMEAKSITANVKVDSGVFEGPPGFKPFKPARSTPRADREAADEDEDEPRGRRRP
jgi:hypothetical protein